MAKCKEIKTNAMRILETKKIPFTTHVYECDEFIDGIQIADMLSLPYEKVYKTLVTQGNSKNYYVFVIPVAQELDLKKAAKTVGEKSVELIPVKQITAVTGYVRGGCTPIGMKKQFPTYIQEDCILFDHIFISAGQRGLQIQIKPTDLITFVGAIEADITI
mgnify:CR=1 FL=1